MNPTELPNPEITEGSAAMASSSFSTSQMRNISMPNQADQSQTHQLKPVSLLSGAEMYSQQTDQAQFNRGYCQVQSDIEEMNFPQFGSFGVALFQQTSQSQLDEPYQNQSGTDQSISYPLQSTSGGVRHYQQSQLNQAAWSQTDQLNSLQYASGRVVHSQQTSQPQLHEAYQNQSQIGQSNSLHSQQSQLNQAGQNQTDQMNSLQPTSDRWMHSPRTSQPHLSEPYQSQTDKSNSLQRTSSGVRNSQQFELTQGGRSQTDQFDPLRFTSSRVMPFEETRQPQLSQGEPSQDSQQTKSGNGKTISEAEKIKRRAYCKNYRDREREKKRVNNDLIISLRKEKDLLAAEKQRLLGLIHCPQPNEQLPAQARQSHIQHQQIHHPSFSAPVASFPRNHLGTDLGEFGQIRAGYDLISASSMERDILAAKRRRYIQASTSCPQPNEPLPAPARQSTIEQFHHPKFSARQLNGSRISNDSHDPHRPQSSSTGGIISSSNLKENQENSRPVGTSTLKAELLKKINENNKSNVNFSDFTGLGLDDHGERVAVGRFSFPKSLQSTAEKIREQYGDVTKNSKMHPSVDERTYILFCATIKEMGDQQLDEVTEYSILKWSDTIKDALRIDFDVGFAMNHLMENIVPAYIGRIECQEVDTMALTISKLEATLNASKQEYAERYERSKVYKDAIEKFNGKSVSTGLFM